MCGIAGFTSGNWDDGHLHRLIRCLQHRGPDAEGSYFDRAGGIGLGHRRLSILDLSEAANQPFYSADGRYVMVYNGEVYNYKEVASRYNITVNTTSDTEVIIEAFAKAGVEAVRELNGMFAMAIWDRQDRLLYLFRDRVGIKPLYYCSEEKNFAFASELKSLVQLPVTKKLNKESISNFLYLGYIPGDQTIYENFQKVLPGHYLIVKEGIPVSHCYWDLEEKIRPVMTTSETKAKAELKDLLFSSVGYNMISDVPLGVFLSGGVDSSLVAAIAQSISPASVKTFSIGFKESKYNESGYARQVARHIGSDHHEFTVTQNEALELVEKLTSIYDEPYADSSAIPTLLVSEMARKEVTVALSGDGGDELFMGYGFYYWARRLNNPLIKALRKPIAAGLLKWGDNRKQRASFMFNYPSAERRKSHIFSQEQYLFSENEIRDILTDPVGLSFEERLSPHSRKLDVMEEQSFFDIKNYLPEELLVKTDRASMYHGLEVRVPLLDHRIVEFAINLSPDLKLRGNTGKYLLKQVLYDLVPPDIFNRPKWGFAVPLQLWLSGELSYLLDKYLSTAVVEECGLVKNQKVQALKKQYLNGRTYLYNRLWVLIQLHKWYKENIF